MLKNLTLVFGCLMGFLTHSASAQTYFSQDFSNVTGAYPTGWTRHNLDGLTPDAGVAFNFGANAWICRALGGIRL